MTRRKYIIAVGLIIGVASLYYFEFGPRAAPVSIATDAGVPAVVDVSPANARHDRAASPVSSISQPRHGTARILSTGQVEYRPAAMFFGDDNFQYTIRDWLGRSASAAVTVTVRLNLPKFLKRSGSASLSEMLQQPPTSIYGSSINVFAYMDNNGIAEIDVAGHADARTCSQASGLLANTLLTKGSTQGDFLLAGSSHIIGSTAEDSSEINDPDVKRWLELKAAEQISNIVQQPVDPNSEAELKDLELKPAVKSYRENVGAGTILAEVLKQFDELSASSGLIVVHRLPSNLPARVKSRIENAIKSAKPALLRFDDLIPTESGQAPQEAVVFVPLLDARSGAPIIIDLPLTEFSADRFREAVQEHRDTIEVAMVGNARERERVAETNLERTRDELRQCKTYTEDKLRETVNLNRKCTQDGCFPSATPQKMSRNEYCNKQLPYNEKIELYWKEDAAQILETIKMERAKGGGVVDNITHSALVDSMLRDWVLPVHGSQAAFDYWRLNRRDAAWEAVTRVMDTLGIDRRLLSGEDVVFPITAPILPRSSNRHCPSPIASGSRPYSAIWSESVWTRRTFLGPAADTGTKSSSPLAPAVSRANFGPSRPTKRQVRLRTIERMLAGGTQGSNPLCSSSESGELRTISAH